MKKIRPIFLILIIIILVIFLDFITVNNTKNTVDFFNSELDNIDNILLKGKMPIDKINELVDEREKRSRLMAYYLEHDEIEKIGNNISLIQKQIEIEDVDDARQSIAETKFLFKHIEEKQILNIENFF